MTTAVAGVAPGVPQQFEVDPYQSPATDKLALRWVAPPLVEAAPVMGYYLYRRSGDQAWRRITPSPVLGTSHVDERLRGGTSYEYRLVALAETAPGSKVYARSVPATLSAATQDPDREAKPFVQIVAPTAFEGVNINFGNGRTDDTRLTKLTAVTAVIDDANAEDTPTWTLELQPVDAPPLGSNYGASQPVVLARGTGRVGDMNDLAHPGRIAAIDPSLYPNGNYRLTLTAWDQNDAGVPLSEGDDRTTSTVLISLYSAAKSGNLQLPVTDLEFDVPGGQPITVRRVYDSQQANVLGDFGYGWRLESSAAALTYGDRPADKLGDPKPLRYGDVVYVTVPGEGQHAFQFFPVPHSYNYGSAPNPYAGTYTTGTYSIQFVCVDGSDATLRVAGDINEKDFDDRTNRFFDSGNNRFLVGGLGGEIYHPARSVNSHFVLTTADGTEYTLAANSGQLLSVTDANGQTETLSHFGAQGVTSGDYQLQITRGWQGTISKIELVNMKTYATVRTVEYEFSKDVETNQTTGDLVRVTGMDGQATRYAYDDADLPHRLTSVIDPTGLETLRAAYDSAGRLREMTDAKAAAAGKPPAVLATGGFDGTSASQAVTDLSADANTTESIRDDHGNVVREIRSFKVGAEVRYSVTVRQYDYWTGGLGGEVENIFYRPDGGHPKPGTSSQGSLTGTTEWRPFEVSGPNADQRRYTDLPPAGSLAREVTFYGLSNTSDVTVAGTRMPKQETVYLDGGVAG